MSHAEHLARLPPARPGNVAFLANLAHIFFDNTSLTDELRHTVRTLGTYGGRLYPLIGLLWDGPDNLLFVERMPPREFDDYFGGALRLRLPRVLLYDPEETLAPEIQDAIRPLSSCAIDGFVTDERLAELAERTGTRLAGSVAGSRLGNNKVLLHRYLAGQGLPVFDTVTATAPAEVPRAAEALARLGYPQAVIKSAIGASGIGLIRFATASPPKIPDYHFLDGPCLVQGWLDASRPLVRRVASPSVQMLITETAHHLYDLTDQILSTDSIHEGNIAPPESFRDTGLRDELLRQAAIASEWLRDQGYRGTASTDFHLAFLEDGRVEVRICEVNARVTGATYPAMLARHFLPDGTWLMRNLHVPAPVEARCIFDDLENAGLLYQPGSASGVLPINFNTSAESLVTKGQFLILGPDHDATRGTMERILASQDLQFARD